MFIDRNYVCVIQEEKWFSAELKKELDKVQGHLKQVIPLRWLISNNILRRPLAQKLKPSSVQIHFHVSCRIVPECLGGIDMK